MQVNWTALWLTWQRRDLRELIVLIPIILIMLLPVGLFSGEHLRPSLSFLAGFRMWVPKT